MWTDVSVLLMCVKQIDTLAAEYPARSNYLYLTYHGEMRMMCLKILVNRFWCWDPVRTE